MDRLTSQPHGLRDFDDNNNDLIIDDVTVDGTLDWFKLLTTDQSEGALMEDVNTVQNSFPAGPETQQTNQTTTPLLHHLTDMSPNSQPHGPRDNDDINLSIDDVTVVSGLCWFDSLTTNQLISALSSIIYPIVMSTQQNNINKHLNNNSNSAATAPQKHNQTSKEDQSILTPPAVLLPGNSGSTFHCGCVLLSDKAPGKPYTINSEEERRVRELVTQKENLKTPEEKGESEKERKENEITSAADPEASGLLIRKVSHKLRDKQLRKLKMTRHYGNPLRGEKGGGGGREGGRGGLRQGKEVDIKQDLINDLEQAFSSDNLSATHVNSTPVAGKKHTSKKKNIPWDNISSGEEGIKNGLTSGAEKGTSAGVRDVVETGHRSGARLTSGVETGKSGGVGVNLEAGSEKRVGGGGSIGAGKMSGARTGPDKDTGGDLCAKFPGITVEPTEKMSHTRPQSHSQKNPDSSSDLNIEVRTHPDLDNAELHIDSSRNPPPSKQKTCATVSYHSSPSMRERDMQRKHQRNDGELQQCQNSLADGSSVAKKQRVQSRKCDSYSSRASHVVGKEGGFKMTGGNKMDGRPEGGDGNDGFSTKIEHSGTGKGNEGIEQKCQRLLHYMGGETRHDRCTNTRCGGEIAVGSSHLSKYLEVIGYRNTKPIIGLGFVLECRGIARATFYLCVSCSKMLPFTHICTHIVSIEHQFHSMWTQHPNLLSNWWHEGLPQGTTMQEMAWKHSDLEAYKKIDAQVTLLPQDWFERVQTAPFSEAVNMLQIFRREKDMCPLHLSSTAIPQLGWQPPCQQSPEQPLPVKPQSARAPDTDQNIETGGDEMKEQGTVPGSNQDHTQVTRATGHPKDLQDYVSNNRIEAVVGLSAVIECSCEGQVPYYFCVSCGRRLNCKLITHHVLYYRHRLQYLSTRYPWYFNGMCLGLRPTERSILLMHMAREIKDLNHDEPGTMQEVHLSLRDFNKIRALTYDKALSSLQAIYNNQNQTELVTYITSKQEPVSCSLLKQKIESLVGSQDLQHQKLFTQY